MWQEAVNKCDRTYKIKKSDLTDLRGWLSLARLGRVTGSTLYISFGLILIMISWPIIFLLWRCAADWRVLQYCE